MMSKKMKRRVKKCVECKDRCVVIIIFFLKALAMKFDIIYKTRHEEQVQKKESAQIEKSVEI